MRARYYDPELARFISEDPIGIGGGMNLYAFAGNNPVNFRDPYGLDHCTKRDPKTGTAYQPEGTACEIPGVTVTGRKSGGGGTVYGGSGRGGSWYRPTRGGAGITWKQLMAGAHSATAGLQPTQCISGAGGGFVNAVAGFGDAASMGASYWVRENITGGNENVDRCANAYRAGQAGGITADLGLGGLSAARAAGWTSRIALHPAHHSFGRLGKLTHIQVNIWRKGVKGSGLRAFRVPLPWR
jgi:uncharacterized protein RhaS with RHS repeats